MRSYLIAPIYILSMLVSALITIPFESNAQELELINRPVNRSGLTGLLFTTSPFTAPARSLEFGIGAVSEQSTDPDYSLNEIPSISLTRGLENGEIALKSAYFRRTTIDGDVKERGAGDTELSYKLQFLPQSETSPAPAAALVVTAIAPTSDTEANISGVKHWGARLGLSAGREIIWGDHTVGVYADGQIVLQDLSDERLRDRYGIMNGGLVFPISKYRNLQMLFEYSIASGMDRATAEGGDYTAITYGLRVVNEGFNLSFGTQFVNKKAAGFDDSSRITGMMSIKL